MKILLIMRLVIHIGTEKTGTTTLQHFIYKNRLVLERYGVGLLGALGTPDARKLAAYCGPRDLSDEYFTERQITNVEGIRSHFDNFQEELRRNLENIGTKINTVFVSSEHLHSRLFNLESVNRCRDFFAPHFSDIKIVCYFREQSEMARSSFSTCIKSGHTFDFESYLLWCKPSNPYYNFLMFFKWWEQVFGKENLIPRIYHKDCWIDSDIRKDLLSLINKDMDWSDFDFTINNLNPRFNSIGIELGRINNLVNPCFQSDGRVNLNRLKVARAIEEYFCGHEEQLEYKEANSIYDSFNESNTIFAQNYLSQNINPFPCPNFNGTKVENLDFQFKRDNEVSARFLLFFEKVLKALVATSE